LQNHDDVRSQLDKAAAALGYPEAAKTYKALVDLNTSLKSFSGRLAALTINLLQAPWTLLILALLIIGLPLSVGFLLRQFGDQIGPVGQRVGEVSAFLFGLITWLKTQLGRGLKLVGEVDTALDKARRIRQDRIASSEEVRQAQQAFSLAQAAEEGARSNLQAAQAELQRLQREMEDLRPERKLYRLIEERAHTAAYSQHLGIISLIRTDFEQMGRLLMDMVEEKRDLKTQDPPIQRIILYIDDLDRCRPERVVQVLEAVHLLLAFPLFIVVVGVDPRWLRHSLAYHHPQTLSENGQRLVLDGNTAPADYSTPQDYLEKIFQIPFALRPVQKEGYKRLVTDLLQPLPEPVQREPQSSAAAITATESPPAARVGRPSAELPTNDSVAQLSSAREPQHTPVEHAAAAGSEGALGNTRSEAPQRDATPFTPLNPEQLDFKAWEEQDIYQLWPLFRTPRGIKRFVNIYRLLRASLATDVEVTRFEGTKEQPVSISRSCYYWPWSQPFPTRPRGLCIG
jgi:hypothetical protein